MATSWHIRNSSTERSLSKQDTVPIQTLYLVDILTIHTSPPPLDLSSLLGPPTTFSWSPTSLITISPATPQLPQSACMLWGPLTSPRAHQLMPKQSANSTFESNDHTGCHRTHNMDKPTCAAVTETTACMLPGTRCETLCSLFQDGLTACLANFHQHVAGMNRKAAPQISS